MFIVVVIGASIHKALLSVLFELVALAYTVYNRRILGGQGQSLGKRALGITFPSAESEHARVASSSRPTSA